jgi:hypothetical protein
MILDITAGSIMFALTPDRLWPVGALAGALWLLPSPVPRLRGLPEEAA